MVHTISGWCIGLESKKKRQGLPQACGEEFGKDRMAQARSLKSEDGPTHGGGGKLEVGLRVSGSRVGIEGHLCSIVNHSDVRKVGQKGAEP